MIKEDLDAIKAEFAVPRKTLLEDGGEIVLEEKKEEEREMVFAMDRFGYCKLLEKNLFEKNQEAVCSEHVWILPVMTGDKVCFFADSGVLYQVKASELPTLKLKEKGIPLDNVSRFDGTKERVLLVLPAASLKESTLLFATEQGMIKTVLGTEFLTANRMVAATKLAEGDKLAQVRPVPDEDELVLSTSGGMVIKFPLAEVPELKKNSRGVRGMKLEDGDRLEHVYFAVFDKTMEYRGKEVALGRLKLSKRDGKGTKIRLDRS